MKFNYQARTQKGEVHKGNIEASSNEAAIVLLQRHGLYVTFLEAAQAPVYARRVKVFERITRKESRAGYASPHIRILGASVF